MSASALLSVLTGVAPQGASSSAASDVDQGQNAEAGAVFAAMLGFESEDKEVVEISDVTDSITESAAPIVAAPVTLPQPVVRNLPLTEEAARGLLDSEAALDAPSQPAKSAVLEVAPEAPATPQTTAPEDAAEAAEVRQHHPTVERAPRAAVEHAPLDPHPADSSPKQDQAQTTERAVPQAFGKAASQSALAQAPAAEGEVPAQNIPPAEPDTVAAKRSPPQQSQPQPAQGQASPSQASLASLNAALEQLARPQATPATQAQSAALDVASKANGSRQQPALQVADAPVQNAPVEAQTAETTRTTDAASEQAQVPLVQARLMASAPAPLRHYRAEAPVQASDKVVSNAAVEAEAGNALEATTSAVEASIETTETAAQPKTSVTITPELVAGVTSAHVEGEAEAAEIDLIRLQQAENEAPRVEAQGTRLSLANIRTTAEIAAQMINRLGQRTTRFDMVLTPETLGNVEVTIEVGSDGQMQARLAFENPQAANALRDRAEELRRQLIEAGFSVAENALEFTDRESNPQGGFNQFMSDGRSSRRAFAGASRLAAEADVPAVPVWTPVPLSPSGVDMKV